MKQVEMNLHAHPFERILSHHKVIEMRLYDERRRNLSIGDEIVFINNDDGRRIRARITGLQPFEDFYALYANYPKTMLGYLENENADPSDMYQYYSKERIDDYGVLAIHIELLGDVI